MFNIICFFQSRWNIGEQAKFAESQLKLFEVGCQMSFITYFVISIVAIYFVESCSCLCFLNVASFMQRLKIQLKADCLALICVFSAWCLNEFRLET